MEKLYFAEHQIAFLGGHPTDPNRLMGIAVDLLERRAPADSLQIEITLFKAAIGVIGVFS